MSFYLETTDMDLGDTPIENIFINDYMPMANGTYVKVYLLGFKYAHDRDMDIEVDNETIARHLEIPMEDVLRAWDFWEEKGIIKKIRKEDSGYNFFVKFLNLKQLYIKNNIGLFNEDSNKDMIKEDKEKSKANVSKPRNKSKSKNPMMQLIDANRNPDINNMFNNIDNILRRQTVPIEKQKILSWISDYNMSPEVIEKAFLYSVESRDIRRFNYIEAIVRNWYDEGITTLDKVLDEFNKNDEKYFRYMKIMKELGLANRPIKDDEKEMIDTWFKDGFSLELILEACKRDKNPVPSVRYVNGILESWKIKNITSVDDIEVLDVKEKRDATTSKTNYQNRPKQVKTRFHNFEQRSSNYSEDELEDIARRKREEHMKKLKGEV
ncbi:MAG TPA: DnaD domain protein [Tissierellaceae bacterium]